MPQALPSTSRRHTAASGYKGAARTAPTPPAPLSPAPKDNLAAMLARGRQLPSRCSRVSLAHLQAMGEYIKSKGLKFGIYSDAGNLTCAKYPGSLGYEKQDAQTFASWGGQGLGLGCGVVAAGRLLQPPARRPLRAACLAVCGALIRPLASTLTCCPHP